MFDAPFIFEVEPPPVNEAEAELKRLFGIELGRGHANPFEAAIQVFPHDTKAALNAASKWIDDPIVLEAKENYKKASEEELILLDKQQLAARLLAFAEEKIERDGNSYYTVEAKDRLTALQLYAKIRGFDKPDGEENKSRFKNNSMQIKFVNPPPKKENNVQNSVSKSELKEDFEPAPINLRLVKSA